MDLNGIFWAMKEPEASLRKKEPVIEEIIVVVHISSPRAYSLDAPPLFPGFTASVCMKIGFRWCLILSAFHRKQISTVTVEVKLYSFRLPKPFTHFFTESIGKT
jgi:hypothetical protein